MMLRPVDPVLRCDDICQLLKVSPAQFYRLREQGWFGGEGPALIEIEPPIDTNPRYRGEPFASWLDAKTQDRARRSQMMTAVK